MTTRTRTIDDRTSTSVRITSDSEAPRQPITVAEIVAAQTVVNVQGALLRSPGLRILVEAVELLGTLGTIIIYTPGTRVVGNPLKPVVAGPIHGVPS